MKNLLQAERLLKLKLQFFAENNDNTEQNDSNDNTDTNENTGEKGDKGESNEPTLTDEQQKQVDARVSAEMQRRTKEIRQQIQNELDEKQKEADKYRKMNAEQKHKYELEKAEQERDAIRQELETYKMRNTASTVLSDAGFHVSDELLDVVVSDTADKTNAAVTAVIDLVNKEVQRQLESKAIQTNVTGNNVNPPKQEESWKQFTHI